MHVESSISETCLLEALLYFTLLCSTVDRTPSGLNFARHHLMPSRLYANPSRRMGWADKLGTPFKRCACLCYSHLLEMMCLLASSPVSSAHTGVTSALREILAELLKTRPGMLFLLSDNEAANCLHRALLQVGSPLCFA